MDYSALEIPSEQELLKLRDTIINKVNKDLKTRHDKVTGHKSMQEIIDTRLYQG